jgi:hypothetical protein
MGSSSVRVEVKPDFRSISEELRQATARALGQQIQVEKREIVLRTKSGIDKDGVAFPQLSEGYRKTKEDSGRTGTPDLTYSGAMLQSMSTEVKRAGTALIATITMGADQAAKATAHITGKYGKGATKKRDFFGLGKVQIDRIIAAINTATAQAVRK